MKYIKCPICELNYMFETEEMCEICYGNNNPSIKIVHRQKSTIVTTDQFFAGENLNVKILAKKLIAEIEKSHPDSQSYAISGTGDNKGYLALKKERRNFVIFEIREGHLRVNLLCTPDIYKQLDIRVDTRNSDNSCAFSVTNESQLENALKMIDWAYQRR